MASDLFLRFIINRLWEVKGVRVWGEARGVVFYMNAFGNTGN